jgi:hypothetical protein
MFGAAAGRAGWSDLLEFSMPLCKALAALALGSLCSMAPGAAAYAADSAAVIAEVNAALGKTRSVLGKSGYPRFHAAIASAYQVADVSELGDSVSVALVFRTPATGNITAYVYPERQAPQPAASALKVVLAVLASKEAIRSPQGWNTPLGHSTLGASVRSMVAVSDNAAANRLLDAYGIDVVNTWLGQAGFDADALHFSRQFGDFQATALQGDNTCTALGLATFYALLAERETLPGLGSKEALGKALQLLDSEGDCNNETKFNDRLNGLLPDVAFYHKTGSNADVLVDAGIFAGQHFDYELAVIDKTKNQRAIQRLGRNIYRLLGS